MGAIVDPTNRKFAEAIRAKVHLMICGPLEVDRIRRKRCNVVESAFVDRLARHHIRIAFDPIFVQDILGHMIAQCGQMVL